MRRVLVPLDGSTFSEAILPDARRLAGPDGELILVREASLPFVGRDGMTDAAVLAVEEAEGYLRNEASALRAEGVNVRTQALMLSNPASAIDEAVRIFRVGMIAIATHGRNPLSRLFRGGVAWRALAHSEVPVLLRHVENPNLPSPTEMSNRRIMVPLDGSAYAEMALPVAIELAMEWNAQLWLTRVIPAIPIAGPPYFPVTPVSIFDEEAIRDAEAYLGTLAANFPNPIHVDVGYGSVVDVLAHDVERFSITDVVMASHGRTGLSRVILGSVADELIHRLHCSFIVIPALAADRLEARSVRTEEPAMAQI
jgi:nucleotide-binding universal stress UspA family protein